VHLLQDGDSRPNEGKNITWRPYRQNVEEEGGEKVKAVRVGHRLCHRLFEAFLREKSR